MPGHVKIPAGEKIALSHGKLQVPDHPVVPFIEGDGRAPTSRAPPCGSGRRRRASLRREAPDRLGRGVRRREGAGGLRRDCPPNLLPPETLDVIREYLVAIKGPLTTPVGEGFRSLNVTLRQELNLYVSSAR